MSKCIVCQDGDYKGQGIIICNECHNKGYTNCDMLDRCVGQGYLNRHSRKNYNLSIVLPSAFFNNQELRIIDDLLLSEIKSINEKNYCCIECYKNAIASILELWHSSSFIEEITGLDKMMKTPNQKPFFDKDGKYLTYLKSIKTSQE